MKNKKGKKIAHLMDQLRQLNLAYEENECKIGKLNTSV